MIKFTNLAIRRGARQLFHGVIFTIHQGNKVGLTGANGCGKSSLFEALAKALVAGDGAPCFEARQFHRAQGGPSASPAGPIRLQLTFEERKAGEWDKIELGVLQPLLKKTVTRPRQLVLRLKAHVPEGNETVEARWNIFSPGMKHHADELPALERLQALNRFVWLRGGSLFSPGRNRDRRPDAERPFTADIAPLAEEIEKRYQALVSGTSRHERSEIKAGYEAALELLARRAVEAHSAGALSGSLVEEILNQRGLDAGDPASDDQCGIGDREGLLFLGLQPPRPFHGATHEVLGLDRGLFGLVEMDPRTLVPDVGHFEQVGVKAGFAQRLLEQGFVGSRCARGYDHAVEVVLFDDLLHPLLGIL